MRFTITPTERGETLELRSDDNSIGWYLTGLDGWWGTPAPREDPEPDPMHDGDMPPESLTQGARALVLEMAARCESSVAAERLADQVCGLFGQDLVIVGEGPSGPRMLVGHLADDPKPRFAESGRLLFCAVAISCPKPSKRGREVAFRASGGSCSVVNEGNMPAWPVVRVSGRCTSLSVSYGGQAVTWSGDAEGLVIDFATGQASAGTIGSDDAFAIPPGRHALSVSSVGGGEVSVCVAAAWR